MNKDTGEIPRQTVQAVGTAAKIGLAKVVARMNNRGAMRAMQRAGKKKLHGNRISAMVAAEDDTPDAIEVAPQVPGSPSPAAAVRGCERIRGGLWRYNIKITACSRLV